MIYYERVLTTDLGRPDQAVEPRQVEAEHGGHIAVPALATAAPLGTRRRP
jgi:hypothetical protein